MYICVHGSAEMRLTHASPFWIFRDGLGPRQISLYIFLPKTRRYYFEIILRCGGGCEGIVEVKVILPLRADNEITAMYIRLPIIHKGANTVTYTHIHSNVYLK